MAANAPVAGTIPSAAGPLVSGFVAMNRAPLRIRRMARVICSNDSPRVSPRTTDSRSTSVSTIPEPAFASAATLAIQIARDEGRLVDPNERGFRSGIRMESAMGQPGSRRIGIAYSESQLLDLHWLRHLIKWSHRNPGESIRGPNRWDLIACRRHRCLTTLLVALESRYLPEISRPTVHLTNADYSEWATFRSSFDPVQTLANIGCPRDRLPFLADHLLSTANRVDPLKGRLSSLIRRTSQNAWCDFEGYAREAHYPRRADEGILLCP